jgi:hypothetical protein
MKTNLNRILEIFWLILAGLTAFMGVYATVRNGFKSAYVFFIMAILSFLLYLARRTLRLNNKD